jgi:AraC-like DNA-binding protein
MSNENSELLSRRDLLCALRNNMIPWARERANLTLLAEPPFVKPPDARILHYLAPLLQKTGRRPHASNLYAESWNDVGLHATSFPLLGCVLEGEADLEIGTTESMATQGQLVSGEKNRSIQVGQFETTTPDFLREVHSSAEAGWNHHVLQLPQQTFFAIPASVPHNNGKRLHWLRPHPEMALSCIFWCYVMPTGAMCHICRTEHQQHELQTPIFLWDAHLISVVELLLSELRVQSFNSAPVVQAYWLAILLRLERVLTLGLPAFNERILGALNGENLLPLAMSARGASVVRRASEYIRQHLSEDLTPDSIARNCQMSVGHLNRLIHSEHGMSIMRYVTHCRMETAKSLLNGTNLPIENIAQLVGYEHLSHFSATFTRLVQVSPKQFRKQNALHESAEL